MIMEVRNLTAGVFYGRHGHSPVAQRIERVSDEKRGRWFESSRANVFLVVVIQSAIKKHQPSNQPALQAGPLFCPGPSDGLF